MTITVTQVWSKHKADVEEKKRPYRKIGEVYKIRPGQSNLFIRTLVAQKNQ